MDEIGVSNSQIAPEFGLAPNEIWQMKTGARGVRPDEILIWARVLQVHPGEIFRRFGYAWTAHTVPVVGTVQPDSRIRRAVDSSAVAPCPVDGESNLVAVIVEKDVPSRGVKAGALIYYEPYPHIHMSAHSRLCVLGLGDHPSPILGKLESAALGSARITVWVTGEIILTDQAISATPIRWIKAG